MMKNHRLLQAIVILIIGAILFALGWLLLEAAQFSALILFPISISLLLLGIAALISALILK